MLDNGLKFVKISDIKSKQKVKNNFIIMFKYPTDHLWMIPYLNEIIDVIFFF